MTTKCEEEVDYLALVQIKVPWPQVLPTYPDHIISLDYRHDVERRCSTVQKQQANLAFGNLGTAA